VALGFGRPPDGITGEQVCAKVSMKISELLKSLPPHHLGNSLIKTNPSDNQWKQIEKINQILFDDYKTRRELLLKRLDVTIQSFKWADRLKVNSSVSTNFIGRRLVIDLEQKR
jgi:hypothetical protein